jgi:WD40 repeat protein
MVDRPWRVFVSRTSEMALPVGGRSCVEAARDAIIRAGDAVVDMTYFPAAAVQPAAYCRERVLASDVYIGLIGFRFGSLVPGLPATSFTELEYRAAVEAGKPRLIFLLEPQAAASDDASDDAVGDVPDADGAQRRFRELLLAEGGVTAMFRTPADLEIAILHTLLELHRDRSEAAGSPRSRPWMVPPRTSPVVPRPQLTGELLRLLTAPGAELVGITMALQGTGGFGKTTLAAEACRAPEVAESFPGGVLWVTVGERIAEADLAAKINDLSELLSGQRPALSDPEQAGYHLGDLLGEQRRLLVVDDVWHRYQLLPFLQGGPGCIRLVTTRSHSVLPDDAAVITVDVMERSEARALLAAEVPDLPEWHLNQLASLTGCWPVLLGLVSRALRRMRRTGAPSADAAAAIERRLRRDGPAALDIRNAGARDQAVAATIEASLSMLPAAEVERYLQLAVFPEDMDIPLDVLDMWWNPEDLRHSGERLSAEHLCEGLSELSLVSDYRGDVGTVRLHDVIYSYLRRRVGSRWLAATNADLLAAARSQLLGPEAARAGEPIPWWLLPAQATYFWRHLAYHLSEAGRRDELASVVRDLRFVTAKLQLVDPVAVEADLALVDDPVSAELRRALGRTAHLLTPTVPDHALAGILLSRLDGVGALAGLVEDFAHTLDVVRLANRWPLPDTPDQALRRVLRGDAGGMFACVVGPDGTWLAATEAGGAVRIWDVATGRIRAVLTGHIAGVRVGVASPDGTWLATGDAAGEIRIWDLATYQTRRILSGHTAGIYSCAVSPDGTWLATGDAAGEIRVWDLATYQTRTILSHTASARACAAGPDGTWLVSGDAKGVIRIWDLPTGAVREVPVGHSGGVRSCAVGPDGTWVASADSSGAIRVWDVETGRTRRVLAGHTAAVQGCVIGPGAQWLMSVSEDRTLRIWDLMSGTTTAVLSGHTGGVQGGARSPDGTWLASADQVGVVRIWDLAQAHSLHPAPARATGIQACAFSPDGRYLAVGEATGTLRIWDVAGEYVKTVLAGHTGGVWGCQFGPDGSWLASVSEDQTVRIWDLATAEARTVLSGHDAEVWSCSVSPDGRLLASSDSTGTVRIWDLAPGGLTAVRERQVLRGHTAGIWDCQFGPDGSWLASVSEDQTVRIWDLATGSTRLELRGHDSAVWSCAVSTAGDLLVSADAFGTMRIWEAATGQLRHVLTGHQAGIWWCALSPDGSLVASTAEDQTVRLWDTATGRLLAVLEDHTSGVWTCVFSPDGSVLASADAAGAVHLWDVDDDNHVRARSALSYHASVTWCCAASADGAFLASGGIDAGTGGTLRIWDTATRQAREIPIGDSPGVRCTAVSPDGSWLVTADAGGTIRRWDVATGQAQLTVHAPDAVTWACAISPDASWLMTAGADGIVRLWDAATGRSRGALAGHHADVRTCLISPDGTWLATGDIAGTLLVRDSVTGQVRTRISGHPAAVSASATSADGTWLATGDAAGTIRLWDVTTGTLRRLLRGHTAGVRSLATSSDGRWLASVDTAGTLRIWDPYQGLCQTMMRVEDSLFGCCWLPNELSVCAVGVGGVFCFTLVVPAPHQRGRVD